MFIFQSFGNALPSLLRTLRLANHSQLFSSHMCTSASSFWREPTRMEEEFHWIERNAETSVLYLTSSVFAQYVLLVQTPKNKFSQQIVLIIRRYYKLPSYHWASKTTWFWGFLLNHLSHTCDRHKHCFISKSCWLWWKVSSTKVWDWETKSWISNNITDTKEKTFLEQLEEHFAAY